MSSTEFNYEGTTINIQCNPEEKMEEILQRFSTKIGKSKDNLLFIYNGGIVNADLTYSSQINKSDKERNKMSILVNLKPDEEKNEEESLKKSQYIICPQCKESARILIDNYKIGIYSCINGHKIDNILISDFEQTQNYDEAKIKCQSCQKVNKSTSYNNTFYICFDCKKKLCQLCKSLDDKSHNIIDYDDKFFTCDSHYEPFNSYCTDCKRDTCTTCEMEHAGHKIITYGSILPNIKKIKEEKEEFFNKKEALKKDIKEIINKLNNLIYIIDDYFGIYEDIIQSYGNKKRNYFLLQNIHDFNKFNIDFIQDINNIIEEKNIFNKIKNVIDIYNKSTGVINKNNIPIEEKNINNKITNKELNIVENESQKNTDKINSEIDIKERNNNDDHKDKKSVLKEGLNTEEKKESQDEKKTGENKNKKNAFEVKYINEKLMLDTEKNEDNNYKNFDLNKISKILSFDEDKLLNRFSTNNIFILKDGRIIIYMQHNVNNEKHYNFVLDLKNKNFFELNIDCIYDIIQMNDGLVIAAKKSRIVLMEIKKDQVEIIKSLDLSDYRDYEYLDFFKLVKSLNNKIFLFINKHGFERYEAFIYEKKDIKSLYYKRLKSTSDTFVFESESKICLINENKIAINYKHLGLFGDSFYISIFDLEDDKMIQTFTVKSFEDPFALINDDLFIVATKRKLYPYHIKSNSKKKEYKFNKGADIISIVPLNEKMFIVAQNDYLNQFELDSENKFKLIYSVEINNYNLLKYPKNRLLFYESKYNKTLHLYG